MEGLSAYQWTAIVLWCGIIIGFAVVVIAILHSFFKAAKHHLQLQEAKKRDTNNDTGIFEVGRDSNGCATRGVTESTNVTDKGMVV